MLSDFITVAVLAVCLMAGNGIDALCRVKGEGCNDRAPCCSSLQCGNPDGGDGFCERKHTDINQPSEPSDQPASYSSHTGNNHKPQQPSTTRKPSGVYAGGSASVSSLGFGSGSAASHSFASGSSYESPYGTFHTAHSAASALSSANAASHSSSGSAYSSASSITKNQFRKAVTVNGFPSPSDHHYTNFMTRIPKFTMTGKRELAMFLAHVLHETDGLRSTGEYKQIYAPDPEHPDNGKNYYGRGYLQLSWVGNYRMASRDLFNDDRLVEDPDQVATDEDVAWDTGFWYWATVVRNTPGVLQGRFGASVMAVNGANECVGGMRAQAKRRFEYYKKVLAIFVPGEKPVENGCYN